MRSGSVVSGQLYRSNRTYGTYIGGHFCFVDLETTTYSGMRLHQTLLLCDDPNDEKRHI